MIKLGAKAASLAKNDKSTAHVAQIASADVEQSDFGDVREIAVAEMRPDPSQARKMNISLEMLRNPDAVADAETRHHVDAILGLAESLRTAKQRQPVEVYAQGAHFNIVAGERRWWAAQVAELRTLWAKVLPEKPGRLRLIQYVENAQREGLSTKETLQALTHVLSESQALGEAVSSFSQLKRVTGLPNASASRWWSILNGPEEVRVAINAGTITGLVAAERLARTADAGERAGLLELLSRAEKEGGARELLDELAKRPAQSVPVKPAKRTATRGRGRPQKVVLGTTSNLAVARLVLERIAGPLPEHIASDDARSLTRAIASAIRALEARLG